MIEQLSASVEPSDASSWLTHNGWQRIPTRLDVAQLWQRNDAEILQPLRPNTADYSLRWWELLRRVAQLDKRPEEVIALEMLEEGSDVCEWSAQTPTGDYTIALSDGELLLKGAKEALLAAASSTIHRKGYFGHSVTKTARNHVDSLRMGQTRRGSYVIPVISRVPGATAVVGDSSESLLPEELGREPSFQRRVMERLAKSLTAVSEVTLKDAAPSTKQINELVIETGVSHELCEGLTTVLSAETLSGLEINFSWARRSPSNVEVRSVQFSRDAVPVLKQISDALKGSDVIGRQTLSAYVSSIKRDREDIEGTIRLRISVGATTRTVVAQLNDEQYRVAGRANEERRLILIKGKLVQHEGARWRLEDVESVSLTEEPALTGLSLP